MSTNRTHYQYHFKLGNKFVHTGITNDIDRREGELQRKRGWRKGHMVQVGVRTSYTAARDWELEQAEKGKPVARDDVGNLLILKNRDTYKYHFKLKGKIVRTGITGNLNRCGYQLQQKYRVKYGPFVRGQMIKVGYRTTLAAARAWEDEQAKKGKPVERQPVKLKAVELKLAELSLAELNLAELKLTELKQAKLTPAKLEAA